MYRKTYLRFLTGLVALVGFNNSFAQQGTGIQCPDCQVGVATSQDLAEVIADITGVDDSDVTVIQGDAPGTFQVILPDDSRFSVAPVGLSFRHQNMVQRSFSQTYDGGLLLRSESRLELQLRSAVHREADVVAEMLRLGWDNFYWFRNGMEVEAPNGTQYCFQPDMQVYPQTAPAGISISLDPYGNLNIIHPDGIRQDLHACAHDLLQLRDQVRTQVQQQLAVDTDGTITVPINGNTARYRLNAQLRWSGVLDQPGFIREGDRLFLRYRDGWEQEIIEIN